MGKSFLDDNNYTRTINETYAAYNTTRSSNSGTSTSDSPVNVNGNRDTYGGDGSTGGGRFREMNETRDPSRYYQ